MTNTLVRYARLGVEGCGTPFDIYKRIEGACGINRELSLDLWAMHECLLFLKISGDTDTLDAIKEIYLKPFLKAPDRATLKNEISGMILRYSCENYVDERTVYRRLRKARDLWGAFRRLQLK